MHQSDFHASKLTYNNMRQDVANFIQRVIPKIADDSQYNLGLQVGRYALTFVQRNQDDFKPSDSMSYIHNRLALVLDNGMDPDQVLKSIDDFFLRDTLNPDVLPGNSYDD